jgi:hypothetical protein
MTLPYERKSALHSAREFLRRMLDPKATPRISKELRKEAYYRLKHYPSHHEIDMIALDSPKILSGKKYEDESEDR